MPTIAVYGATGYTGRLIAAELARRGIDAVLCGRRADALAQAAAAHGQPTRVAAYDEPAALRRAFADCDAVISAAGPFGQVGREVVRAAIDAGCHYVDTTGEQPFIAHVLDDCDAPARAAGVAAVSGMGFDYLPGDLLCAVAAEGLGPLRRLTIAYAMAGFGATRGTMRSALLMLAAPCVVHQDGARGTAPARQPLREFFDFGAPLGRRQVARYPAGEALTVPRHVEVDLILTRITASTFGPAPLVPALTPALAGLMRTPLRGALDRAIGRLPPGPDEQARRAASYTLVAECVPRDPAAPTVRATLTGADVYGITAVTTVEAVARMTAAGYDRRGALAPAEAFDARAFLDALAPHGIVYETPAPT